MTPVRTVLPGATRTCPHCRATILERANRCPQCQKHLRNDPDAADSGPPPESPFRVEGTIRAPANETWEYDLLLVIHNAKGEEVSRKLMDVGALMPGDARTFTLSVELSPARPRR